jgi:hypothetical protein
MHGCPLFPAFLREQHEFGEPRENKAKINWLSQTIAKMVFFSPVNAWIST